MKMSQRSLDRANVFQAEDGVVAYPDRPLLDAYEPAGETRKRKAILLARVYDHHRAWRGKLRSAALRYDRQGGMGSRRRGALPSTGEVMSLRRLRIASSARAE